MSRHVRHSHEPLDTKMLGRTKLVAWVNRLLSLNYKRIEDLSNGAAFCQIIDLIHPGTVPLARVNFASNAVHDATENLKILQEVFTKNGLTEPVPVSSLSRGHYTAALHLVQFLYSYYRQSAVAPGYDAAARRQQCHCREPGSRPPAEKTRGVPVLNKSLKKGLEITPPALDQPPTVDLRKLASELQRANNKLKEEAELMTQERDFYYEKLRKVEEFCQDNAGEAAYRKVLDILYETDEANGFVAPDEVDDAQDIISDDEDA